MQRWEEIAYARQDGRAEGKVEGKAEEIVEMGLEFHLSEQDILERLQSKLDLSLEKAQEYFDKLVFSCHLASKPVLK